MKTKLQALIAEQKALTARFEELMNETDAKPYAFIGNESKAEAIQSFLGAKSACFDSNSIYLNINGECSEFALVPAFMPMIAQFYTIINLNEQPYFFEELNNTDPKKVYIKGHPTRGAEVIKMLEDLGGVNKYGYNGLDNSLNYFIDKNNEIDWAIRRSLKNYTELHLPEVVSAENTQNTDIKVGNWIWIDDIVGYDEDGVGHRVVNNNPHYVVQVEPYGIFVVFEEQHLLIDFSDKFHKVKPPKEKVEKVAKIMSEVLCEKIPYRHPSGLSVGMPPLTIRLNHPELRLVVEVGHLKSDLCNYNLAKTLYELALEEYVK